MGERICSVAVDMVGAVGKINKMDSVSLQQIFNSVPLFNYRYGGSFQSDYVPTPDNDNFAIINVQPINMQGKLWIMIANYRHKLYFTNYLARPSFLNQQYEQMMTEQLHSLPCVCCFYAIYSVFHLFNFWQEEIFGVNDVKVLSIINTYLYNFFFLNVYVQVIQSDYYCLYLINFPKL